MDLVQVNENAMAAFGNAAAAMSGDSKPIMKFNKGDWMVGSGDEDVPHGTKLALDLAQAEWGWVRWKDNKPAERRMSLVASGAQPVARDALGHLDEDLWERDSFGRARDPWQKTIELHVREIAGEKREFIMAGSSRGFEGACKALFSVVGGKGDPTLSMRANPGKVPVIALGSDKYKHPNPEFGMVKVPVLTITEWRTPAELDGGDAPAVKGKQTKF